jgi:hypothetical protein
MIMKPPIIWLDRGEALNGEVTVRTVWQFVEGSYRRTRADALILWPTLTELAPLYRRA